MSSAAISPDTMRGLTFARYLYTVAREQTRQPYPLYFASVMTFHDSIELFLGLAAEYKGTTSKGDTPFMSYWALLGPLLPSGQLTQKKAMERLNRIRVALKHHGIMPSKEDFAKISTNVTDFFEENTPEIFGLPFSAISMLILVLPKKAREHLELAQSLLDEGKRANAIDDIAIAFAYAMDNYERCTHAAFGNLPAFSHRGFSHLKRSESIGMGQFDYALAEENKQYNAVVETVSDLQEATRILAMGLDYRRYTKFKQLTPQVLSNPPSFFFASEYMRKSTPSPEDSRFCFDFVIETALRLQDSDL